MIGLLQRVLSGSVEVDGAIVGAIASGIVVMVAVLPADTRAEAERLLERIVGYRVFADEAGRMNLSLADTGGGLLLVPQFTLAADTRKGTRPSFSGAAPPEQGRDLFDYLVRIAAERHRPVASGVFGAHMRLSLTNDGPVTIWLEN
jgi:D-aminoacyl-tRNA deacylase